jgi:DNA-binding NarL/FixJ family response regulator
LDAPERLAALQRAIDDDLTRDALRRVASLTPEECDLLRGILGGHSAAALAAHLHCCPNKVEQVNVSLRMKLGAKTTADVVRIAIYAGLDATNPSETP